MSPTILQKISRGRGYNVKNAKKRVAKYYTEAGAMRRKEDFMDTETTRKKKRGAFSEAGDALRESFSKKDKGSLRLGIDIGTVALGFLFGGCHLIFGSYPLGLALVSALPSGVWLALIGVVLGSLTLGKSGIIYGMICVLSVLLRIIISGGKNGSVRPKAKNVHSIEDMNTDEGLSSKPALFSESGGLRVCAAVISGFVAGIYEILLNGMSLTTVVFGAAMIALPGALTLLFTGAFYHGVGVKELIVGKRRIFMSGEDAKDKLSLAVFKVALLGFIFFASISLDRFNIFGVNLSYVFSGIITLFVAKRFGPLYGAVSGFFASVGISGLYSVAFALAGAAAGALYPFGVWYAISAGGALMSVWGAYVGGVSGFLTVLPEFLVASTLMIPISKYLERETAPKSKDTVRRRAMDMVGTMALAYRNNKASEAEALEKSLLAVSGVINAYLATSDELSCSLFSKLMNESRIASAREREMNEELTDALEQIFIQHGFAGGVIRAFGERRKHFICSGEDKDGEMITSPALRKDIEECAGVILSEPEYFRRDDMVLMVADSAEKYVLDGAYATTAGSGEEISGDTVRIFKTDNGMAYGLISDGMGSGDEAKRTSEFVADFLSATLGLSGSPSTLLHMMNSVIRRGGEECGATVDLFSLDLVNGCAEFVKSGAVASFVKRHGSLFRIKSETVPVGLIKQVDAERISVSVAPGDYIIMFSDGIAETGGDAPWLVELLNKPNKRSLREYASVILEEAKRRCEGKDDKTVLVLKIRNCER